MKYVPHVTDQRVYKLVKLDGKNIDIINPIYSFSPILLRYSTIMSSLQRDIAGITEARKIVAANAGDVGDSFSVVSYNILADCWVLPDW